MMSAATFPLGTQITIAVPRKIPDRRNDEQLLEWLWLRDNGVGTYDIAAQYGVTAARVRVATNRVRDEDRAHDRLAAHAYKWRQRNGDA